MLKRLTIYILSVAMLLLCACTVPSVPVRDNDGILDERVASMFLNAVRNREFVEAYSFLSSIHTKEMIDITDEDGKTEQKPNESFISVADFEKRYQTIFELLGVKDFTYELKEDVKEDSGRIIKYTLTYDTEYADKLTYDFEMREVTEADTWKIDWTPALILPDLEESDTLVRARLAAKRGDITAGGKAIACTVNLVTVYVVPSEVIGRAELIKYIMNTEGIQEAEAAVRLNVYTNDYGLLYAVAPEKFDALAVSLKTVLAEPNNAGDASDGAERPALPDNYDTPQQEEKDEIKEAFNSVFNDFMMIKQYYPNMLSEEQIDSLKAITGVHIDTSNYGSARYYPYGGLLAHTLGYVGYATADEAQKYNEGRLPSDGLYTEDSMVGKNGLEQLYETELRGRDGYYFFIRGSDGTNKRTLYRREQEDGLDIRLTIDLGLQLRTEELLDVVLFGEDTAGAVVVMNPKTGAVEAMASYPSFDLNEFTNGISKEAYNALLEQENAPLYNRTLQGLYPPGSTFKAFTAAAALDSGVMNKEYIFTGKIENDYWTPTGYGAWHWPAIKRTRVLNRTEPMNMTNSMLHSDNIYFANAALKIGAERFIEYMQNMGMSERVPFELNVHSAQLLNKNTAMDYKLLADSGYGQGEVLVTPLQLTTMFCAFRNDGNLPAPYIVDGYYKNNGLNYDCVYEHEQSIWHEDVISDSAISNIIPMLQGVVDPSKNGTGRSLHVTNCDVAGKTGSAEIGRDKSRIISWFAGFRLNVDADDERVVLVMLEIPDSSGYTSLKFQIARELLKLDDSIDPNMPYEAE